MSSLEMHAASQDFPAVRQLSRVEKQHALPQGGPAPLARLKIAVSSGRYWADLIGRDQARFQGEWVLVTFKVADHDLTDQSDFRTVLTRGSHAEVESAGHRMISTVKINPFPTSQRLRVRWRRT